MFKREHVACPAEQSHLRAISDLVVAAGRAVVHQVELAQSEVDVGRAALIEGFRFKCPPAAPVLDRVDGGRVVTVSERLIQVDAVQLAAHNVPAGRAAGTTRRGTRRDVRETRSCTSRRACLHAPNGDNAINIGIYLVQENTIQNALDLDLDLK